MPSVCLFSCHSSVSKMLKMKKTQYSHVPPSDGEIPEKCVIRRVVIVWTSRRHLHTEMYSLLHTLVAWYVTTLYAAQHWQKCPYGHVTRQFLEHAVNPTIRCAGCTQIGNTWPRLGESTLERAQSCEDSCGLISHASQFYFISLFYFISQIQHTCSGVIHNPSLAMLAIVFNRN